MYLDAETVASDTAPAHTFELDDRVAVRMANGRWWPGVVVSTPVYGPATSRHIKREGAQLLDVVLDGRGQRSTRVVGHAYGVRKFTTRRTES